MKKAFCVQILSQSVYVYHVKADNEDEARDLTEAFDAGEGNESVVFIGRQTISHGVENVEELDNE